MKVLKWTKCTSVNHRGLTIDLSSSYSTLSFIFNTCLKVYFYIYCNQYFVFYNVVVAVYSSFNFTLCVFYVVILTCLNTFRILFQNK